MQRRALLSLRSVLVAVAGLAVLAAGAAAVIASRGPVTVVENAPAELAPEDFDGRDQDVPLVVEEPANSTTSTTASNPTSATTPLTSEPAAAIEAGASEENPDSGQGTTTSTTTTTSSSTSSSTSTTTSGQEPSFLIAPLPEGVTDTPCSVVTDGSPATGEVAFVNYRFTGPFALFDGTSVDIPGPQGGSTLLQGKADPTAARDGDRFPFVIRGAMVGDDGFAVTSTLADGEVVTRCKIAEWSVASPCKVILSGPAETGQEAEVVYNLGTRFQLFEGQPTHIMGWNKKSVLAGGGSVPLQAGTRSDFTINGYMFRDGPFEVRTSLADGAAHAVCRVAEG